MSARPPLLRRVALGLMNHAARTLRLSRPEWADAMRSELQHIDDDREALTWAIGCLVASYMERSRLTTLFHAWYARGLIASLMVAQALDMLFATALTLAYRLHSPAVAQFLGGFTPGDSYRRFIPLMEATPWWIHTFWFTGSALCLVAAGKVLRNRPSAFLLFAGAWTLGAIGDVASHALPAYQEAFSFPSRQIIRDYFIPAAKILISVFVAGALWAHDRCTLTTGEIPPDPAA